MTSTALKRDGIGRNRSVADSCFKILHLERVAGGKPVPACPGPALSAAKASQAAELAIRSDLTGASTCPPAWLSTALRLHRDAASLDVIAATLHEAGHPPEAVQLAIAAVRSDMRRLGLFWSRLAAR